ncbi:MAG: SDR family NAD(P)-dependent oxidoreductase [Acidimicrobiia bacterium]
MQLTDANVVVTGASRGIGRRLVDVLVARRARVALVARSADVLDGIVAAVGADRVAAFPCDLGDAGALDGLIASIEADRGPVDALVNNAGLDHTGSFVTMTASDLRAVIGVNLTATAELCRQVLPGMIRRDRGSIVNVSSIGGSLAGPGLTVYCATKAGVNQLTAGLRAEVKGTHVRPTLVEIGPVSTEMIDSLRAYEPARASVARLERVRLSQDLDPHAVAVAIADAIGSGRRHLRLPRRQAPVSMLAEAPRRIGEWLTLGIDTANP